MAESNKITGGKSFYRDIERNGLKYIKGQKRYLVFTAIFPIYALIVQVFNLFSALSRVPPPAPELPGPSPLPPRSLYDILTPIIIFMVISVFALVKFIFLYIWMNKVKKYDIQQKSSDVLGQPPIDQANSPNSVSFTQLFYDIVNHMQRIRVIFILLNFIFLFYLQWSLGFFLTFFGAQIHPNPPPENLFYILNAISQFGLIFYMGFEWKHFIKWNKKIVKLTQFEKQIYNELEE